MDIGASYKITWAMFFCNLAILLHHANLKNYFNGDGNSIIIYVMDFFSVIAIPAMTWFFFISGYLFFRQFEMNQLQENGKVDLNPSLFHICCGIRLLFSYC